MALDNLAGDVGDESCKLVFDPGMDVKESSHTGGAASELLGGFTFFALTLCRDIADILVVCFLSKPIGMSAFVDLTSWSDRNLHCENMIGMRITLVLELAEI